MMPNLDRAGWLICIVLCIVILPEIVLAQGSGHRVTNTEVIISGRNQWKNWVYPTNTLNISSTGEVSAKLIKKETNAVFDIVEYLRYNPPQKLESKNSEDIVLQDAISGGSNVNDVVNVLDGNMSTYWQPSNADPDRDLASQWYFIVDLGRIVFADKLVLKFVEEGLGDPFSLFEVLISDGQEPAKLKGSGVPLFSTVLRTLSKNTTQRVFEIDLSKRNTVVNAAPVRFVQIIVTNTEGNTARELTLEEYESLDDVVRGATQYYKRQPEGGLLAVEKDLYELLDEDRKGGVKYFRKEMPRLAELEVWNQGDELNSGILARGGTVETNVSQPLAFSKFFDGKYETFNRIFYGKPAAEPIPDSEVKFDLGAFYWIDSYRISFNGGRMFDSYKLEFSDGTLAPDGSLQWQTKADVTTDRGFISNTGSGGQIHDGMNFEPVKARFARLQWTMQLTPGARTADVSELQFYGEGHQPQISMVSDLIRLGGSRNLLSIEWDADTPPGTNVNIQTRTGNELGEILHYYNSSGIEVTESAYGKLLSIFKGEIIGEQVAGSDWSDWSEVYVDPAGSVINSPSPREFLMVRATLESNRPDQTPILRSIRMRFSSPVAQSVIGEISPFRVNELAKESEFSLFIKPDFARNDKGFDELLLVAPSNMRLDLSGIFGGTRSDLEDPDYDLSELEEIQVISTDSDSLHIRFAQISPNSTVEGLRLDFKTSLFLTGAVLKASLRNSSDADGGTWQRVDPGNAVGSVEGNTTTLVSATQNSQLLTDITVSPEVFSPNGDDINDVTEFSFNIVRVGDNSPVSANVYSMDGKLIRSISEDRELSSGRYTMIWDGRHDSGQLASPGNYIVQMKVDTDIEGAKIDEASVTRLVSVAY